MRIKKNRQYQRKTQSFNSITESHSISLQNSESKYPLSPLPLSPFFISLFRSFAKDEVASLSSSLNFYSRENRRHSLTSFAWHVRTPFVHPRGIQRIFIVFVMISFHLRVDTLCISPREMFKPCREEKS